ncbi:MAG: hypothetical protein LKJ17_05740 [Oscillospiraceae bacterium]|jgi:hypothetical protein|nr:hypothetical protein [Oscillospiraceae bacterium]
MKTNPEQEPCNQTTCTGPIPGNSYCAACRLTLAQRAARKKLAVFPLSDQEAEILGKLSSGGAVTVCRFVMSSSKEDSLQSIALAPVVIHSPGDTVALVKERGAVISQLVKRGLISLKYDGKAVPGFDEQTVRKSAAFTAFQEAVNEGSGKPNFLFDTALLETGSMEMTDDGAQAMLDYYRL